MKSKLKYILPILGIAAAVGIGVGASPRVVSSANNIIFGEDGPIKLISPDGVVLLTNANQSVSSKDYIVAGDDFEHIKRYAFFVLDLNDGFSIDEGGTTWLGVELKASTNNFGMIFRNPPEGSQHPCYWSCTESQYPGSDESMSFVIDPNATQHGSGYDNRGWIRIFGSILQVLSVDLGNLDGSFKFPRKIGVLVGPDMLVTTSDNKDWLRSDNEEIVWSYMRTDAVGYETNSTGKAIWTICEPSCWFKALPKWANWGQNSDERPGSH